MNKINSQLPSIPIVIVNIPEMKENKKITDIINEEQHEGTLHLISDEPEKLWLIKFKDKRYSVLHHIKGNTWGGYFLSWLSVPIYTK